MHSRILTLTLTRRSTAVGSSEKPSQSLSVCAISLTTAELQIQ